MTSPLSRRDLPRLALLLLAAAAVWVGHGRFWSPATWRQPASYNVDALETLARFQLAAEQGAAFTARPVVERLGAPWHADWSGYPMPDAPWYWMVGRLVRAIGLMPASHAALALAHLLAVAAMYVCARLLGQRPLVAAAVGLLFGFAHAISYRGLSHHSFMLAYIAPLGVVVAALIARSRVLLRRRRWQVFCLAVAAGAGAGNPYFIFMTMQLLGFALLWQLPRGRRANLLLGCACLAVCGAVFVALNLPALRTIAAARGAHEFRRNPAEANLYGLRPAELATPPPRHPWTALARRAEAAARAEPAAGERFSSYLGLAGLAGAVLLLGTGVARARRIGFTRFRPGLATVAGWILVFAMVGGINSWLARAGFDIFRAGNRYAIYLAALALLALGRAASSWSRGRSGPATTGLVIAAVAVGLWDQLPRALPPNAARDIGSLVDADRAAAATLRSALPAGAMIFQVPAPPFPEAGSILGLGDYEHVRPFLHNPHLRFSYGSMRGTAEVRWAAAIAELPAAALVTHLAEAGFRALWVDRRGFPHNAAALVAELGQVGARAIPLPGADHVALFAIEPAASPTRPDLGEVRWYESWRRGPAAGPVTLHAVTGWHPLEQDSGLAWRWAEHEARLGFWNDEGRPVTVALRFHAASLAPGTLELSRAGQSLAAVELGNDARPVQFLALELPAGSSALEFRFNGRLVRPPGELRSLGFRIDDLAVSVP